MPRSWSQKVVQGLNGLYGIWRLLLKMSREHSELHRTLVFEYLLEMDAVISGFGVVERIVRARCRWKNGGLLGLGMGWRLQLHLDTPQIGLAS